MWIRGVSWADGSKYPVWRKKNKLAKDTEDAVTVLIKCWKSNGDIIINDAIRVIRMVKKKAGKILFALLS